MHPKRELAAGVRDGRRRPTLTPHLDRVHQRALQVAPARRNKQKRHDLSQVGLSYALDGEHGLVLCRHVYPGQLTDSVALPVALARIGHMLDRAGIPRETVTLMLDKGSAALANTLELQAHGLGRVSALPWHQARWCCDS